MKNLDSLMEDILCRPGLYIAKPSLRSLYWFLQGIKFANTKSEYQGLNFQELREFTQWLAIHKYPDQDGAESWYSTIARHTLPDVDEWEEFRKFWKEYLDQRQPSGQC